MRDDGFGATFEPSCEEILKTGRGKWGEPVNAVGNLLEMPRFRIVGEALPPEADFYRLTGCEVSSLLLCNLIESVVIRSPFSRALHCVQHLRITRRYCTHYIRNSNQSNIGPSRRLMRHSPGPLGSSLSCRDRILWKRQPRILAREKLGAAKIIAFVDLNASFRQEKAKFEACHPIKSGQNLFRVV